MDLACLLRLVPEIDVRIAMPFHHAVGARTLVNELSDKGLVLIDGVEVNVDAFGLPLWAALPVHIEDVERIEVVRGPGSALYGANSHSMVVAITTRRATADTVEAMVAGGELGSTSLHLRVTELLGDWRLRLSGGRETTGSWEVPGESDREVYRARLQIDHDWGGSATDLDLALVFAEGTLFTMQAPIHASDTIALWAAATHRLDFLKARVWFNMMQTDARFDLPLMADINGRLTELGKAPEVVPMENVALDGDVQADWEPWADNLLIGGVNYRWLVYESERNAPTVTHQHRVGVYLQDEQRFGESLLATAGARFDYNSITPSTFSPRLALVWKAAPDHVTRLSASRAFRKPSFFNTSFHMTGVEGSGLTPRLDEFFERSVGNPDLKNEGVSALELGYRGRLLDGDLVLEANAFVGYYQDRIGFEMDIRFSSVGLPDLQASRVRFVNLDDELVSAGGSVSVTYRVQSMIRVSANYTFRRGWIFGGSGRDENVLRSELDEDGVLKSEPAHLANAWAVLTPGGGLRLGLGLGVRSAYSQYSMGSGGVFSDFVRLDLPSSVVTSGFLAWRVELGGGWLEAGVRAFDVTGARFRETTAVERFDGVRVGGQLLGRKVWLFLRGAI